MAKRILRTIEILGKWEEADVRNIVSIILYNSSYRNCDGLRDIVNLIKSTDNSKIGAEKFISRYQTGKAAEDFFVIIMPGIKFQLKGSWLIAETRVVDMTIKL